MGPDSSAPYKLTLTLSLAPHIFWMGNKKGLGFLVGPNSSAASKLTLTITRIILVHLMNKS